MFIQPFLKVVLLSRPEGYSMLFCPCNKSPHLFARVGPFIKFYERAQSCRSSVSLRMFMHNV